MGYQHMTFQWSVLTAGRTYKPIDPFQRYAYSTYNKDQLSLTNPRDALHHGKLQTQWLSAC